MRPEGYELVIGVDLPKNAELPHDSEWRGQTEWIVVAAENVAGPLIRLAHAFELADLPVAVKLNPIDPGRYSSPKERALSVPMAVVLLNAAKGAISEMTSAEEAEPLNDALRSLRAWDPDGEILGGRLPDS